MEKDTLLKKDITISGLEMKITKSGGAMTKLKDEQGLNYNLFHTKKDGQESKAYGTYKWLPAGGIGQTVEVVYKESDFTNEHGDFKSRNVVMINLK